MGLLVHTFIQVHDEREERRKEREAEAKSGGLDGMVMIPPSVTSRTQWLVTTVWRAEYLPVMDTGPIGRHGGDFYTMVGFFFYREAACFVFCGSLLCWFADAADF